MVSSKEKGAALRSHQLGAEETNESEPLMKCRKWLDDVRTGFFSQTWDKCRGYLFTADMASGIKAA